VSTYAGLVYRWSGYAEADSVHSLLRYVESHGDRLRRRYMAWVHDCGESRLEGKRLIDHLALEDGLSYWWMTLFVEQSPWKSPAIIDALRLFALEEILVQQRPVTLRLISGNRNLHVVLSGLCQNLGIAYKWQRPPLKSRRRLSIRGIYRILPQPVQALISLARHLHRRWPLRRVDKSGWFGGDRSVLYCSYFIHLDEQSCTNGKFYSHQWEGLPKVLHDGGYRANWLQHYFEGSALPNTQTAMNWVQGFNRQRHEQGFHVFVDAYLSLRVVLRVLRGWLKITFVSFRLAHVNRAFCPQGSQFSLWPIMREDWRASLRGPVAIRNHLWLALFEQALRHLPHQKTGLYLRENQAWERAFVHAWRKHGHGRLIGVVHSTVRYWDLRYFTDPRTVRSLAPYPIPQPDITALNGKATVDAYLSVDYPKAAIAECEAVRYGYLHELRAGRSPRRAKGHEIKVLVLGDYLPSGTIKMMRLLEAAVPHISNRTTYTVKPHPSFIVKAYDYPSLHLEIVMDPLGRILHDFDVAYSSSLTSAAVDAYLAGLPVVVVLDETTLNFSPLRGQPGVRFVSTPEQLAEALQTADQSVGPSPNHSEFFFLDPALPRWQRLLSSTGSA